MRRSAAHPRTASLDAAACLGLALVLRDGPVRLRRWVPALAGAGMIGTVAAHAALLAYILTPLGPVTGLDLSRGWIGLYQLRLERGSGRLDRHLMP